MKNNEKCIDVRNIKAADCKPRKFSLSELGLADFQVVVRRSTLNVMKKHGLSNRHAEVIGVLVGDLYWDDAPFLLVEASIDGKYAISNATSVRGYL